MLYWVSAWRKISPLRGEEESFELIMFQKYKCYIGVSAWRKISPLREEEESFDLIMFQKSIYLGLYRVLPVKLKCFSEQKIKEKSLDHEI